MDEHETADQVIARLAAVWHGVVRRATLTVAGLTRGEIDSRIARAALLPVHRGVYALGHRSLSAESRWLAAVLACGPGAALQPQERGGALGNSGRAWRYRR